VEVSVQQQQRRLLPPPLVSDGKSAGASRAKRARFHGADVDRDLMVMQPPSRRRTPLAAGFSEPSLLGALDPERRPEEPAAFANEQYDSVNERAARDPGTVRCHWHVSQLLVTKCAQM